MRRNTYVPDELAAAVEVELPGLNWSEVLQAGLRARLGCRHDVVVCAACGLPHDVDQVKADHLAGFFSDLRIALEEVVHAGGTAEGAARVAHRVGRRWSIVAASWPLPRPARSRRRPPAQPKEHAHARTA